MPGAPLSVLVTVAASDRSRRGVADPGVVRTAERRAARPPKRADATAESFHRSVPSSPP